MKYFIFFITLIVKLRAGDAYAQALTGTVKYIDEGGKLSPLPGATVKPLDAPGAVTDAEGRFVVPVSDGKTYRLVVEAIGFRPDTVAAKAGRPVTVTLSDALLIKTVEIAASAPGTRLSTLGPYPSEELTRTELTKAACCNLSESFETNATVDVSYSDAVTGVKEVQMLGLTGSYTQITTEQLGWVQGLGKTFGLNYMPGTWVESVQIIKGAGSVVNGYEALTGQINAELAKPHAREFLHFNLYGNTAGRGEANVVVARPVSRKWASATMLHGSFLQGANDMNHDGFLDMPKYTLYNAAHRWHYEGGNGHEGQFGAHGVWDDVDGGQIQAHHPGAELYPYRMSTRRLNLWGKTGYVFPMHCGRSTGVQTNATIHQQNAVFGRRNYSGLQRRFHVNWLWQSTFGLESHSYRTGASFLADDYRERFAASDFNRTEWVPGAFFEYTYKPNAKLTAVAGARADWHNLFGFMAVPRLQAKYSPTEKTALRIGGGRAWRTPNIFADHYGAALSSRNYVFPSVLQPEIGWNAGVGALQKFFAGASSFYLSGDYYYTVFENRLLADFDVSPQEVRFRYLQEIDGRSFAHAAQFEFGFSHKEIIEAKAAYKWYDVRETLAGELRTRPLISPHRGLANVSFKPKSWAFDATIHVYGPQRLPTTKSNPEEWRRPDYAPAYAVLIAQVTKKFKSVGLDVYVGGENLGGFRQPEPIVGAADPFGPRFDATMIWGPIMGPVGYVGLRYIVKDVPKKKLRLAQ